MDNWLTTGQMIDSLQLYQIAETTIRDEKRYVTRVSTGLYWCNEIGVSVDSGEIVYFSGGLLSKKWRIIGFSIFK